MHGDAAWGSICHACTASINLMPAVAVRCPCRMLRTCYGQVHINQGGSACQPQRRPAGGGGPALPPLIPHLHGGGAAALAGLTFEELALLGAAKHPGKVGEGLGQTRRRGAGRRWPSDPHAPTLALNPSLLLLHSMLAERLN